MLSAVRVEMNSRARLIDIGSGRRNLAMVTPVYNEPSCSSAACHAHPEKVKVLGVIEVVYDLSPIDESRGNIRLRVLLITILLTVFVGVFVGVGVGTRHTGIVIVLVSSTT